MRLPALGAAVAAALLLGIGEAQSRNLYVSGGAGLNFAPSEEIEGDGTGNAGYTATVEFDLGYALDAAVGMDFGDFRIEGALGYRSTSLDAVQAETVTGGGSGVLSTRGTFQAEGDVDAVLVLAGAWYDFDLGSGISPYLGGGFGGARVSLNDAALRRGNAGAFTDFADDSGWAFAWQFGAGVAYGLSERLALTIDYRYLGTTDITFEETATNTEFDAGLSNHSFGLGVRVGF